MREKDSLQTTRPHDCSFNAPHIFAADNLLAGPNTRRKTGAGREWAVREALKIIKVAEKTKSALLYTHLFDTTSTIHASEKWPAAIIDTRGSMAQSSGPSRREFSGRIQVMRFAHTTRRQLSPTGVR